MPTHAAWVEARESGGPGRRRGAAPLSLTGAGGPPLTSALVASASLQGGPRCARYRQPLSPLRAQLLTGRTSRATAGHAHAPRAAAVGPAPQPGLRPAHAPPRLVPQLSLPGNLPPGPRLPAGAFRRCGLAEEADGAGLESSCKESVAGRLRYRTSMSDGRGWRPNSCRCWR